MLVIRKATREDVPAILTLVKELATYEKEPDAVVAVEADFLRDGYFFSYSTWVGRKCLYLEDLFVKPAHRGQGAGIALMKALAKVAVETDCRRFVWAVLDWNEPAIAFYERLGGKVMREWLTVRLEGDALTRLAC
jgi:GNAT superfamily N-acetyltransferase